MAKTLVHRSEELGGTIYDYANGEYQEVHTSSDEKSENACIEIIDNMLNRGKDAIYIVVFKSGPGRGVFLVVDSNRKYWERFYWKGIYDTQEAFLEMREYCRAVADEMGFRRRDSE
jgi:hypothetical protein